MLVLLNTNQAKIQHKEVCRLYRVDLDLDREQVKQLRQLALDRDTSVRGLVTQLTKNEIQNQKNQRTEKQK
jgi:hypothetical protein